MLSNLDIFERIITPDPKVLPEEALMGFAAMVFPLVIGYYTVQRSRREAGDPDQESK